MSLPDTQLEVLQERLAQHAQSQQQIMHRLDQIVDKLDQLPQMYHTRAEANTLAASTAVIQGDLTRRLEALDGRLDGLKLWLIGALASGLTGLVLQGLQHTPLPK
jgi:hypothetical protein